MDLLTAVVPGGNLVRTSTQVSDWVWDTPPGDLRVAMEQSLQGMGIDRASIDLLLRHRWYPLSLQAALVEALNRLDGVAARPDVMPLALTVASVDQARYLVDSLRMTARYHETVKPLRTLAVFGTLVAQAHDDELVVTAPADLLSWTQTLDRFASQPEIATPVRSLHLAGYLTERARMGLEARGWTLYDNSALFRPIVASAEAAQ